MRNSEEIEEKLRAQQQTQCGSTKGGYAPKVTEACQPCLRDRVHSQKVRAESETQRALPLAELEYLLEKHPEIARIFELMDVVRL